MTDFNASGTDQISFGFGDGGLADNAALRGDGSGYQELAIGGTLNANTGFVTISNSITDAHLTATAKTIADALDGEISGDVLYMAIDDASKTYIYRVADANDDLSDGFETTELLATLDGISDADDILGASNLVDFS